MLDMGFLPDVRRIVDRCPRDRHTSLFSATVPPQIESLIRWAMRNPETVEIGARRSPAETVKHVIYPVAEAQKTELLRRAAQAGELRLGHRLLPDKRSRGSHWEYAQEEESCGRDSAFEPHPAGTRAGLERVPGRQLRSAGGDGHCGARAGHCSTSAT